MDLLQNCDLPPPLKLFSPTTAMERERTPTTTAPLSYINQQQQQTPSKVHTAESPLLRAVQLSQTRAREAEREAMVASTRNTQLAALLLEESLRLSAARRWVRMLELEISLLQREPTLRPAEEEKRAAAASWCLALAMCLGIAGAGFIFSRFMFWSPIKDF